jgi:hypothetical protein
VEEIEAEKPRSWVVKQAANLNQERSSLRTYDAICAHLQAITQGQIQNLIINVPPGHAKSLLTAVFWPAWVWIDHPEIRWLFSSRSPWPRETASNADT